jgi:tetratricopeptide (TPR) repeat protein
MSYTISDQHTFWLEQGKTLTHLNQYEEALASLERSLKLDPDNFTAWVWKAGILTHLNNYPKALASLDKALELCPSVVEEDSEYDKQSIILFRGVVLQELGRHQEAYSSYNQALTLEQNEQNSLWRQFTRALDRRIGGVFKRKESDRFLTQPLGERLQAAGLLSAEQIEQILWYQRKHRHLRFGEIATQWGWIEPETIDFFVEQLPEVLQKPQKKPLGQYLKSAGLLNDFQIRVILDRQKVETDWRFGQIAVRKGWVTQKTVNFFLNYICP